MGLKEKLLELLLKFGGLGELVHNAFRLPVLGMLRGLSNMQIWEKEERVS